jgi:hypothetical protein
MVIKAPMEGSMKKTKRIICVSLVLVGILVLSWSCQKAEDQERAEIADANSIPYPLDEWKGIAGKTLAESKPYFVGPRKAPEGAPNVLVIMLDDAGYSNAGSYGGAIETPTFDRLGNEGIRYTHMSVAAVCSPTRGALLTGYNTHTIGLGNITEFAVGYPGYNAQMDYTTPSIAKILTDNGYATAAFGKWHNTPMDPTNIILYCMKTIHP